MADAVGRSKPGGGRSPRSRLVGRRFLGRSGRGVARERPRHGQPARGGSHAGAGGARARGLDGRGLRPGRGDSDDRGRPGRADHPVRRVEGGGRGCGRADAAGGSRRRRRARLPARRAGARRALRRRLVVGADRACGGARRRGPSRSATSPPAATSPTYGTSSAPTRLLLDPSVPAGTYNVASGRAVEMQEVLDILVSLAACPIEVERDSERLRSADLPVLSGDASRLRTATGWKPTISLEQTLADTLQAARAASERMASA